MSEIIYGNYVINRMQSRGITEGQIENALASRNMPKHEEKSGKTRVKSTIIDKDLILIIKGGYRKTIVLTALWKGAQ